MSSSSAVVATARLYGMSRALRSNSEYARRMKFLSNSIFGEVKRPTSRDSLRVVQMFARKPYEKRKEIVEYYPAHDEISALMTRLRRYGLFRNEHEDFTEEMERIRRIKGKVRTHKWSTVHKNKTEEEEEDDEE